jgi:hypothetical protein
MTRGGPPARGGGLGMGLTILPCKKDSNFITTNSIEPLTWIDSLDK